MSHTYYTHDNGARPFKVKIKDGNVSIYKLDIRRTRENENEKNVYQDKAVLTFDRPERIFIGKSPRTRMTEFSGGYGKQFDGNSLLLCFKGLVCVYIGESVKQFKATSSIIKYVSEVGNNDVPYPYAVDEKGCYYLMIEDVRLVHYDGKDNDPYKYYYAQNLLTTDLGVIPPQPGHSNIQEFWIGNNPYTLRYEGSSERRSQCREDKQMYIRMIDDKKRIPITKHEYDTIMKDFAKVQGFCDLHMKTLLR